MQATGKLVDAGVEFEYLGDIIVYAVLDADMVAHQPDCEWAPPDTKLITAVELFDATPCPDCSALENIILADPRIEILEEILIGTQLGKDPTLPNDAVVARSTLRSVEDELSDLELLLGAPEALQTALDTTMESLKVRKRNLEAHLRTLRDGVLTACQEKVGAGAPGSLMAVGILGWVERVSTNKLVDAIIAVYGHATIDMDAIIVVAPESVYKALVASKLPHRAGTLTEAVKLPEGDLDTFSELIAGLWEPNSTAAMNDLKAAVEASILLV